MKLHILGICGTYMGGLAALAREQGHVVDGSDQNVYPPMSTQLEQLGITLSSGYGARAIAPDTDIVVVGNALSRGNAAVEHVLDRQLNYTSGAEWLRENVLPGRTTLAVAGTHGKTTTTSILAFLLDAAGRDPGFLVGGVPENFGVSARLGSGKEFVVEADEYDTAFFDKRSKFVHYRPTVAILNNLEYDHADIFPDLAAIQRQFHHLVRIVPGNGCLVVNGEDVALRDVLAMGCWTPVQRFAIDGEAEWKARLIREDGSEFAVSHDGNALAVVRWDMVGRHNVMNGLAALAAAHAVGVDIATVVPSLVDFVSVKRRLENLGTANGITVYDDFAHHPTAIRTTLAGLRARVGPARILVAMEPRSNSMRLGVHAEQIAPSLDAADLTLFLQRPELAWDAGAVISQLRSPGEAVASVDALIERLVQVARPGDHVVFMSNGGFEGAPRRAVAALSGTAPAA
ncbi:MAG: UDP-N-acetylmuramate:L-alanyl-gamma-D-glutamyl-meso-diaminopimelate ligase [Frankiaceae bacterium]|nr:UDP-N-acetylmuramate:L-alanyl-gamma-D-glutamyl-meso-diaminopimelate ligase [Arenimonas sp.]